MRRWFCVIEWWSMMGRRRPMYCRSSQWNGVGCRGTRSPNEPGHEGKSMINRRDFLKAGVPIAASPLWFPHCGLAQSLASSTALPPPGADGWISLLNGRDLTGWYTMLEKSGKGVAENKKMVTMESEMLHILGNQVTDEHFEAGYLATNQEFENVRIRVEYKWGVAQFYPR